ncbi:MAG: hypothetical protein WCN81_17155, partial [Actinomycetes bacterium]
MRLSVHTTIVPAISGPACPPDWMLTGKTDGAANRACAAGTANAVRSMLSGYVELLPQVPAQRMVLLSFPAYCLGVMADFRAPLQRAFAQLSANGASIDAI